MLMFLTIYGVEKSQCDRSYFWKFEKVSQSCDMLQLGVER